MSLATLANIYSYGSSRDAKAVAHVSQPGNYHIAIVAGQDKTFVNRQTNSIHAILQTSDTNYSLSLSAIKLALISVLGL